MKTAIIVYGQTRFLEISVKSWDFINKWDCKFYVSTWINSQISTYHEIISEEKIKKYLKNSVVNIFDENKINIDYTLNDINHKKMKFHIKNSLKMIKESNEKYDFLFLMRSDHFFRFNENIKNIFKYNGKNILYCLGELKTFNGIPWINDMIFWGEFDTVSKFIESIEINNDIGQHIYFAKLVNELNFEIKNLEILDVAIVRYNSLSLPENEINFEKIIEKSSNFNFL
jgi:hypothetical protein